MKVQIHEDNHIECPDDAVLYDAIKAAFIYRGAALTLESVQLRLDTIETFDDTDSEYSNGVVDVNSSERDKTKKQFYEDRYNYTIVNGEVAGKDDGPFFILDEDWQNLTFDTETGIITQGNQTITPDDDLTNAPPNIRALAEIVFTDGNAKIYNNNKPLEYEMEFVSYRRIDDIDGIPTLVEGDEPVPKTQKARVKNVDGSDAFESDGKTPLYTNQKILKGPQ